MGSTISTVSAINSIDSIDAIELLFPCLQLGRKLAKHNEARTWQQANRVHKNLDFTKLVRACTRGILERRYCELTDQNAEQMLFGPWRLYKYDEAERRRERVGFGKWRD